MCISRRLFIVVFALLLLCAGMTSAQTCTPITILGKTLVLAWDAAPSQPAGVTLTGYLLERQVDTGAWTAFPALGATVLTYTDATLQAGHTYYYRVSATGKDASGVSGQSGYATMSTTAPPCAAVAIVTAPANLRATPQ